MHLRLLRYLRSDNEKKKTKMIKYDKYDKNRDCIFGFVDVKADFLKYRYNKKKTGLNKIARRK